MYNTFRTSYFNAFRVLYKTIHSEHPISGNIVKNKNFEHFVCGYATNKLTLQHTNIKKKDE